GRQRDRRVPRGRPEPPVAGAAGGRPRAARRAGQRAAAAVHRAEVHAEDRAGRVLQLREDHRQRHRAQAPDQAARQPVHRVRPLGVRAAAGRPELAGPAGRAAQPDGRVVPQPVPQRPGQVPGQAPGPQGHPHRHGGHDPPAAGPRGRAVPALGRAGGRHEVPAVAERGAARRGRVGRGRAVRRAVADQREHEVQGHLGAARALRRPRRQHAGAGAAEGLHRQRPDVHGPARRPRRPEPARRADGVRPVPRSRAGHARAPAGGPADVRAGRRGVRHVRRRPGRPRPAGADDGRAAGPGPGRLRRPRGGDGRAPGGRRGPGGRVDRAEGRRAAQPGRHHDEPQGQVVHVRRADERRRPRGRRAVVRGVLGEPRPPARAAGRDDADAAAAAARAGADGAAERHPEREQQPDQLRDQLPDPDVRRVRAGDDVPQRQLPQRVRDQLHPRADRDHADRGRPAGRGQRAVHVPRRREPDPARPRPHLGRQRREPAGRGRAVVEVATAM
ncbi:MAG: hypothetical protein AVDCRST_MAG64-299, partial [uncultured Phycisphaerae bacterium]